MAKKSKKEEVLEEETEVIEEEESLDELTVLTNQIKDLDEEVNKWKTDYYKVFADMENLKKRMQNEYDNSMKYIMQNFITELLPVIDNFERSLEGVSDDESIKSFLKGYEMIYNQLLNVLKNNGVEVIEAVDKEFDPALHQAVMTEAREGVKSGIVVEEMQKGYILKDRVIRPTLVKVSE